MSERSSVCILGRFPPPNDGQSIMTERLAGLLAPNWSVSRINTSFQGTSGSVAESVRKIGHYGFFSKHLRQQLRSHPSSVVLWTSISPTPIGHLRDLLTIMPGIQPQQKIFAVVHWGDFDRLFSSAITRSTGRRLVQQLSGFVFLDGLADKCSAWIPDHKRFTIPNTIASEHQGSIEEVRAKREEKSRRSVLRILYLSNMIRSKGYFELLESLAILARDKIAFHADFVGRWNSDADRDEFIKFVSAHGLSNCVTAHGGISDRTVIRRFYLNADVFVLPTYYPAEAQPVSILEAISLGTPVITSRHAGIPRMLRENADEALFVPIRSPEAIANALKEICRPDRWLACSVAGEERFRSHFSPAAVQEKWNELLAQACAQTSSGLSLARSQSFV